MMHIKRITNEEDLCKVFKFRQKVLVEELGYLPDNNETLSDPYDNFAHNYAAFAKSGDIAGSIRIVVDSAIGLPVESFKSLHSVKYGKSVVEACRLVIAQEYRSSRLFIKLIAAAYQCALKISSTHIVLDTYLNEEPLYKRLGFKRISEPYIDPGSNRNAQVVAMMLELSKNSLPLIKSKAIQLALMSASNKINHGKLENERAVLQELSTC